MSDNKEALKKLDNAVAGVTKGKDKKEEMMMMIAPYANWGEFIVPAPMSIALLGQLMLISGDTDFTLEKNPPKNGFKVLRYPGSFRACLVQVSNAGWDAFNAAHTNMDQIRLHSGNVDNHVKNAVRFIIAGSDEEMQLMVPKALKNVQRIADECVSLVTSVEDKFLSVMELTAELLEACTNAKGQYEEDLKNAEVGIRIAQDHKKIREEEKEDAKKQLEAMEKEMKEHQKMMKDAMDSSSGWNMIGMSLAEGVSSAVTGTLHKLAKLADAPGQFKRKFTSWYNYDVYDEVSPQMETPEQDTNLQVYCKLVPMLKCQVETLGFFLKEDKPDWEMMKKDNCLLYVKKTLENVYSLTSFTEPTVQTPVLLNVMKLFDDAKKVCCDLEEAATSMVQEDNSMQELVKRFKKLQMGVQQLVVQAKHATGVTPMSTKGPRVSKAQLSADISSSVVEAETQKVQRRVDTAKELLKNAQGKYDAASKTIKESNDELVKLLADLYQYKMKEIDFKKIREILIRGIKALAQLREQWGKMVRFFQMISNLIKCCMNTSLKDFVETAESGQTIVHKGKRLSDMMRDTIYEQAFQANKIAYVVQMISGTYVEISNQHLMDRITCLGHLVALDPQKDEHQFMLKRDELHRGCKDAQEAIGKLVMEKKRDFDEQVENRVAAIENGLKDVLPARSPAAIAESEAAIKSTLDSMDEADVDQFC